MADYDSSLPIRTENNGDAAVKLVDGTTPSQEASVDSSGRQLTRVESSAGNELLPDADGSVNINLRDEDNNPFTTSNPLPVSLEESEGDEINDYQTSSAVAKDASVNHDYIVSAGKTLKCDSIWVSGSGKIKAEIQIEDSPAAGTYTTKWVAFNSTSNPNIDIPTKRLLQVAGANVRVVITNRDNQAQDLYSTVIGVEN